MTDQTTDKPHLAYDHGDGYKGSMALSAAEALENADTYAGFCAEMRLLDNKYYIPKENVASGTPVYDASIPDRVAA